MLHLIAVCIWNFYRAVWIMDHAGLLLTEHEAQDTYGEKNRYEGQIENHIFLIGWFVSPPHTQNHCGTIYTLYIG